MPLFETVIDTILHLEVAGVTLDQIATVGVIVAAAYGLFMLGKTLISKFGK